MLVPKLRFKREDGTSYPHYHKYTVGELTVFHKQGYYTNQKYIEQGIKIARVSDLHNPTIDYSEMPMVNMSEKDYLAYRIENNDFLIARSGSIGRYGIVVNLPQNEKVVFGSFLIKFIFDTTKILNLYFGQFYDSDKVIKQLSQITQKGANVNINAENIKTLQITLPCLEEQQKIADFLSTVDEVIAQSEAEVQNLEQQKKAAMQKIFSQEVRFKREDGTDYPEWEEKSFSDLFKSIPNKDYQVQTKEYKPNGKYRIIDQSQSFIAGYSDLESKVCYKNPCIIFGDHTTVLKYVDFPFIVGADGVKTLITNDCYVAKYCFYLLGFNNVKPTGYNRHFSKLKELTLLCSTDNEEQQKIADFLSAYDEAISYAKQELDKWKELKKGLLQQMFV